MVRKSAVHVTRTSEDHPIFPKRITTYTLAAPGMTAQDRAAAMNAAFQDVGTGTLERHLTDVEKSITEYLKRRGIPSDIKQLIGSKITNKQDLLARSILVRIIGLRGALGRGNAEAAALNAIWFTQDRIEFNVRPHGDDVRRSQTSRAGGAKGRNTRQQDRDVRAKECVAAYQELKKKNPRINPTAAARRIAKERAKAGNSISVRTVERYLSGK